VAAVPHADFEAVGREFESPRARLSLNAENRSGGKRRPGLLALEGSGARRKVRSHPTGRGASTSSRAPGEDQGGDVDVGVGDDPERLRWYPQVGKPPKTSSSKTIRSSSDIAFSPEPRAAQAPSPLVNVADCGTCACNCSPISPTFSTMSWRIS